MQIPPANQPKLGAVSPAPEIEIRIETEQEKFVKLSNRIREAYCRAYRYFNGNDDYGLKEMPYWDGGQTKGRNRKNIWDGIARFLKKNGITDVERFVKAQFAVLTDKRIYPTYLLSKHACKNYSDYSIYADRELEMLLRTDLVNYKEQFQSRKNNEQILKDTSNGISPLFRYILAKSINNDDLAKIFYEPARIQLLLDPYGYLRVWGKVLPLEHLVGLFSELEREDYVA